MSRKIPWGARVAPEFLSKVQEITGELFGYEGADGDLLSCIAFETGRTFSPSVENLAGSSAIGLLQFTRDPRLEMGVTRSQLAAMTAVQQLKYVREYFLRRHPERMNNIEDMYMAILWPAAVGKPAHFRMAMTNLQYRQNAGLDMNSDGIITKHEAAAHVRAMREEGLQDGNYLLVGEPERPPHDGFEVLIPEKFTPGYYWIRQIGKPETAIIAWIERREQMVAGVIPGGEYYGPLIQPGEGGQP
jgi:hypothetical protein